MHARKSSRLARALHAAHLSAEEPGHQASGSPWVLPERTDCMPQRGATPTAAANALSTDLTTSCYPSAGLNSPSHCAITTDARQLPTRLIDVLAMSMMASTPRMIATPSSGRLNDVSVPDRITSDA